MNAHLTRLAGVSHLRDWLAAAEAQPDMSRAPTLRCPCGRALDLRRGRKGNWHAWHGAGECRHAERFFHTQATEQEEAIRQIGAQL